VEHGADRQVGARRPRRWQHRASLACAAGHPG
jgi:hypothetical protein